MSVSLIDGHIDDDVQMTDDEIIKALECCIEGDCDNCPYDEQTACNEYMKQDCLDLINRQKAEIESFKEECSCLGCENEWLKAHYERSKAETVKEFAERLKDMSEHFWEEKENFVSEDNIDNLVKEMVGEC